MHSKTCQVFLEGETEQALRMFLNFIKLWLKIWKI